METVRIIYKDKETTHKIDPHKATVESTLALVGAKDLKDVKMFCEYKGAVNLAVYMPWMCKNTSTMKQVIDFVRRKQRESETGMYTMMFFPSSGMLGFQPYQMEHLKERKIDREVLKKMYLREKELRLSEEVQSKMDEVIQSNPAAYVQLLEDLQRSMLKEFGFQGNDDDLHLFRQGLGMYPEDQEIKAIPYYSQFNRARDGDLNAGDTLVDVKLTHIDRPEQQTSLLSFYQDSLKQRNLPEGSPLVVIAGSIT